MQNICKKAFKIARCLCHIFLICLMVWHLKFQRKSKNVCLFFVITSPFHKCVKSWPLMDTQNPPVSYLHSFSQFPKPCWVTQRWHLQGCSSLLEPADSPNFKHLSCLCVWPECLTCLTALIKRSPLWLVASLWCEVWLKVRGCLFASLWDQPTSPCLCLLLLTQSWWLYYTMAHMSLTYVYQWVCVHLWKQKKKRSDMENHSYWLFR